MDSTYQSKPARVIPTAVPFSCTIYTILFLAVVSNYNHMVIANELASLRCIANDKAVVNFMRNHNKYHTKILTQIYLLET